MLIQDAVVLFAALLFRASFLPTRGVVFCLLNKRQQNIFYHYCCQQCFSRGTLKLNLTLSSWYSSRTDHSLKGSWGGCWEYVSWFLSCFQLWSRLSHARYWTNKNHEKFTFVTKFISALWIQIPNINKQIPVEKYQSLTMKTFIII